MRNEGEADRRALLVREATATAGGSTGKFRAEKMLRSACQTRKVFL